MRLVIWPLLLAPAAGLLQLGQTLGSNMVLQRAPASSGANTLLCFPVEQNRMDYDDDVATQLCDLPSGHHSQKTSTLTTRSWPL
jgi:hypothetical protein